MALETPTVGMSNEGMYARPFENGSEAIAKSAEAVGQNLAGEIDQLSAQILQLQIKAEKERAEAEALSLSNRAYEDLHKNQLEYSQLKNKDAIDNYDSYKQNISKIIEKYTPTDKAQPLTQKLFKEKAMQLQTRSNATLMAYQMEQIASWKMSELNSALNNTLNESLSNYGKPLFEENKRKALEQYDYIADAQGIDRNSETYKLGQLQTTSGLHFNGIMNEINRDQLGNAWKHLQQYKDELTAEDYNKLLINYQSTVARNSVAGGGKKKMTDEDLIAYFEKYFDDNPILHQHVEEGENGKSKITKVTLKDNPILYNQVRRGFVNESLNKHKRYVEERTSQDGYLKASIREYLDNNELPDNGRDIIKAIGISEPTAEQIDTAQKILDMRKNGVGNIGNKMAYMDIMSWISDGSIYKEFTTLNSLKGYMVDKNLSQDQMTDLSKEYNKAKNYAYRQEIEKASKLLNKKLTGVIGKAKVASNEFAYQRALITAQDFINQKIKRDGMSATLALEAVTSNASDVMDIKGVYEEALELQTNFTDLWGSVGSLTHKERLEILNKIQDHKDETGSYPSSYEVGVIIGPYLESYKPIPANVTFDKVK
ncbi:Uncharacterised protein [Anaerobiospirillum thomasii]|uniref:hypothetical protein n=1 Tax=Anaerobiospirillum thomasii TaxID=179995 RepID=UPI000D98E737|nr:hypothetical protein [Anaerobiospirillum thomasii]SPT71512.1 Uncharacterised protein [Anaerobiospirillum thomasii]